MAPPTINTPNFRIEYGPLDKPTRDRVAEVAENAFGDVSNFLGERVINKPIQMQIIEESEGGPLSQRSADPDSPYFGLMQIPANRFGRGKPFRHRPNFPCRGPTFWDGVTKVLVEPSKQGRTLAPLLYEGLGAYLQQKYCQDSKAGEKDGKGGELWPHTTYPTLGGGLDKMSEAMFQAGGGKLLSNSEICALLNKPLTPERRLAWWQAASWVKFLIEIGGAGNFLQYYRNEWPFPKAFGETEKKRTEEWEAKVRPS